jgi:hypothetical protein
MAGHAHSRQGARCLIRYLADSPPLRRLLRDSDVRAGWADVISDHAIGSCQPQRTEFRRSARNLDEYEQMTSMFIDLYPDVPVQKSAWRWIEFAQYRLMRRSAPSVVMPRSADLRMRRHPRTRDQHPVHADGLGVWSEHDRTVAFYGCVLR